MNPIEHTPKTPSPRAGIFALLGAFLRVKGSGASKITRGTGAPKISGFSLKNVAPRAITRAADGDCVADTQLHPAGAGRGTRAAGITRASKGGSRSHRRPTLALLTTALTALLLIPAAAQAGAGYRSAFTFTSPEGFSGPIGLTVDNSADTSKGDVYVVDQGNNALKKFSVSGEAATQLWKVEFPGGAAPYQATVDDFVGADQGDVFVAGYESGVIYRVNPAGTEVAEVLTGVGNPTGVAVDSAGDFFVSSLAEGAVLEYNASWEPITAAGLPVLNPGENKVVEGLAYPQAVAVDSTGEHIYAATIETGTVQATLVAGSYMSATLNGASSYGVTVAPSGDVFVDQGNEFIQGIEVADYEPSGTLIGTFGSSFVKRGGYGIAVSASGVYVANHETGKVDVFVEGPALSDEDSPSVTAGEAEVSAEITTDEETTTYQVQYGTGSVEESSIPAVSVPGSSAPVPVEQRLGGLQPSTTYHYRFLVSNPHGHATGEERTFTTPAAVVATAETCPNAKLRTEQPYGLGLPDCRAYEMVSPLETDGEDAVLTTGGGLRASLSGQAIAYPSAGSFADAAGASLVNEFLSRRAGGRWSTQAITPPQETKEGELHSSYRTSVFTPELEAGVTDTTARLTSDAPEEGDRNKLYVESFAERPSEQSYKYVGEVGVLVPFASPMGASTDLSHVVFDQKQREDALEWVNGAVIPVGVNNDGETVPASVGDAAHTSGGPGEVDPWHAVSADGSRVYFTSPANETEPPGQLYVRVHAEQSQSAVAHPEANATGSLKAGSGAVTQVTPVFAANSYADLTAGSTAVNLNTAETTGTVHVGQNVTGPGIPAGTTVTDISGKPPRYSVTLSAPATLSSTEEVVIEFFRPDSFAVGAQISGYGIPPGTTVTAASGSTLTLSASPDVSASAVALASGGECLEAAKACTVEVSASQRATSDTYGLQGARFWGASTGAEPGAEAKPERVFFTSDAELTNDAYTGTTTEQEVVTEGSYTLSFKGQTTASLEPNATPEAVRKALEGLSSIGVGNVTVSKGRVRGESESTFLVTFGSFAGSEPPLLTAEGGSVSVHLRLAANLYEYELSHEGKPARLTDLTGDKTDDTGEGAAVQGVVQISEDGSYVYFVATGALTGAEENGEHEHAITGADNLYVSHEGGKPLFVTTLAAGDASDWFATIGGAQDGGPANHTAVVNPGGTRLASGARLAFISERPLTGYDNEQAAQGECEGYIAGISNFTKETGKCREIYLYDAETSGLVCASCDPTGARPVGPSNLGLTVGQLSSYRPRNFSEAGALFFDSSDALAPHAKDAQQNVYEYEQGHVYPLSDVAGDNESTFLDAGANGSNVFFASSDKLLPEDTSENVEVWDARVDGGLPVNVAAPACTTAEACRTASPPTPAVFGAPPSATFSGPGNVAPPAPAVVKAKPKSLTRAQKLANALKSCKKDKKKKKRAGCEKGAHQKYGAVKKSSKKKGK